MENQNLGRKVTTNDIYRASYLLCCGGEVSDCYTHRGRVALVVGGAEVAQADIRYRLGKALVNPRELREMINFIRDEYIKPLTATRPHRSTRKPENRRNNSCRTLQRSRPVHA